MPVGEDLAVGPLNEEALENYLDGDGRLYGLSVAWTVEQTASVARVVASFMIILREIFIDYVD